jgi:hypothetical protein
MVPISPREQPSRHQLVFTEARRQLCLQRQLMAKGEAVAAAVMAAPSAEDLKAKLP